MKYMENKRKIVNTYSIKYIYIKIYKYVHIYNKYLNKRIIYMAKYLEVWYKTETVNESKEKQG